MRFGLWATVIALWTATLCASADASAATGTSFALQSSFAGSSDSFFGYSVAIDGATAVVGALDDDGGAGAAYVYVLNGATWTRQQILSASDGVAGDELGYAVAVSGDTAMIGAAGKSNGQGSVYVFTRTGTTWALQTELTSQDGAPNDCFGCAIALRGTTALIGASGKRAGNGGAYFFDESGSTWQQAQTFAGATGEAFGFSVALSSDGRTGVVGAFEASKATGHAYVLSSNGATWSQQATLAASDGTAGDGFGYSVGVDGTTALVGAYASNGGQGSAYVFTGSQGTWTQQQKLLASDGAENDHFGYAVALSGTTALVGAYEKSSTTGGAYVFTNGGAATWWQQEIAAPGVGQSFGYAVALTSNAAVVGAFSASNDAGAAYLFAPATSVAAPAMRPWWTLLLSLSLLVAALWAMARRGGRSVAVLLVASTVACSSGGNGATSAAVGTLRSVDAPSSASTGSVGMDLTLSGGEEVDSIEWSITGPNGGAAVVQSSSVKVEALAVQFLVGDIPAGSGYRVTLSGTSTDDSISCSGTAQFNVAAHATTLVAVQVPCVRTGTGSTGTSVNGASFNCAAWSSVTASPLETKVGSSVTLTAVASGPEPSQLTYGWSSSTGAFGSAGAATSSFTCTQVGPAVVTLTVGDGSVPAGSSCNSTLDTTTLTITCDAGTSPPPAPAMPPWALAILAATLAGLGLVSTQRGSPTPRAT